MLKNDEFIEVKWLSEKIVSQMTGLSVSTLQKNRFHGRGIAYAKIGRAVRYNILDVKNFMHSKTVIPSDSAGILPQS